MKKYIYLVLTLFLVLPLNSLQAANTSTPATSISAPVDSLIKGSLSTIYYYAADGNRYVFPNDKTFGSWFGDFENVKTITDEELAKIPLKGNVTYRPGIRMVKIQTVPKVYVVDEGGKLRWVETEDVAKKLYGEDWNKKIDDISDAFFVNYKEGSSIKKTEDYNPATVTEEVKTINKEKGITEGASTPQATTTVGSSTSVVAKSGYSATPNSAKEAAPNISEVKLGAITSSTVQISWYTNKFSDSQIKYSLWPLSAAASLSILTAKKDESVKNHLINLTKLTASSTYYFKAVSTDKQNRTGESPEYLFATTLNGSSAASSTPGGTTPTTPATPATPGTPGTPATPATPVTPATPATSTPSADTTAPSNLAKVSTERGDSQITLCWVNPADVDFNGVKVLRKTGSYPANITDGTQVYGSTTPLFTDTGLTNGTTYYYRAFTYDKIPNYSSGTNAPIAGGATTPLSGITWNTNKYIIIPIGEVTQAVLDKVVEKSVETTRKSLDGTKVVLKYPVGTPESAMTLPYKIYSQQETLCIMQTEEWQIDATPPVISNISVSVSQTTATITWNTDKLSSTSLNYGLTSSHGNHIDRLDNFGSGVTTSHSITISGLQANTMYHYSVISSVPSEFEGSAASADQTFTTLALPAPSGGCGGITSVTDNRDATNPVYGTVEIGTQCWLNRSLNIGTQIAGNVEQTNNGIVEKYCTYDNAENCTTYGALYEWNEIMNYTETEGGQGLCPAGWHIPSVTEWDTMANSPGVTHNGLKSATGWNGTNTTGFDAFPAGQRYPGYGYPAYPAGTYGHLSDYVTFWSSTAADGSLIRTRFLSTEGSAGPGMQIGTGAAREYGYSVRCVKD